MVSLKRMLNKVNLKGFTLVEMVVTLAIAIIITGIGAIELNAYKEKLILENTVGEIRSAVEQAARVSATSKQACVVRYFPDLKEIEFVGDNYFKSLKISQPIHVYNLSNLQISTTGSMAPHTITISNDKNTRKIKLQMTWGRAINDS